MPASDLEIVRGKGSERTYRLEERFVLRCRERSISERPAVVPGKDSVNKRVVRRRESVRNDKGTKGREERERASLQQSEMSLDSWLSLYRTQS